MERRAEPYRENQGRWLAVGIKILTSCRDRLAHDLVPCVLQNAGEKSRSSCLGAGGGLQGNQRARQFQRIHKRERPANDIRGGAPGYRENFSCLSARVSILRRCWCGVGVS
jgi:hypothetical protein